MPELSIDCPYCENRVVVTRGMCPICKSELKDAIAAHEKALKRRARTVALSTRANGADTAGIKAELARNGFDEALIKETMQQLDGKAPRTILATNESEMRSALFWLVGGILVTVVTYMIAIFSKSGGVYFIAWGPILFGGFMFMRAWIRSSHRD